MTPCDLCRSWPAECKREDRALCSHCAKHLDAQPFDRAIKVLKGES